MLDRSIASSSSFTTGYVYGNPANWPFDHWIAQSPNVVVVSVYYRLDSFGFLAHPAFSAPSPSILASRPALLQHQKTSLADLNAGFLDQMQALRWVHSHIDAFGGDPTKVTINGQSAGGSSVELHLVASGEEGLFSGGIAQSVFRTPLPTPQEQEVRVPKRCRLSEPERRIFLAAALQFLRLKSGMRKVIC